MKCQSVIDVLWCLEFVINIKNLGLYSKLRNKIFVNDHQLKRDEFVIAQRKDGEYLSLSLQRNPGTIVLLTKLFGHGVIISLVL